MKLNASPQYVLIVTVTASKISYFETKEIRKLFFITHSDEAKRITVEDAIILGM